jgi:hypothetical protein
MEIGTILTSAVVAAVVSGLMTGFYNLRTKQREYDNEYYKMMLMRRITAYEQLEELIVALKIAVLDVDNQPYHLLFSQDSDWQSAYNLLAKVMSAAMWLSDDAFKKTQELNYLIFRLKPEAKAIQFGKTNYQKLAQLRADLEGILASDLLTLHDLKRFLRQKKNIESGFREVNLHR